MGYVYIYRSGDADVFKIGRSTDLDKRIKTHATGNPEPLTRFDVIETEHAAQCETYLHHRLRTKRSTRSEATEFFEVDPDELSVMIADARHYAEEVLPMIAEAERLATEECDERVLQPSPEQWEVYRTLVAVREQYETLEFDVHRLEAELKLAIGTAGGMERVANWKMVARPSFDSLALKAARPDVYDAFAREIRSRTFKLL